MSKGKILYVEDEKHGSMMVHLLEDNGYAVAWFRTGRTAINEIRDGLDYQLGIFDRSLPDIGCEEVIEISKELHPEVPIICHSAYDDKPHGADVLIRKTVSAEHLENLLSRVDNYLNK